MNLPCEGCISYAMCINQSMVRCSILFDWYKEKTQTLGVAINQKHADILDIPVRYLKMTDWSLMHDKYLTLYKVIEANKEGPAMTKPNTPYKFSNGMVASFGRNK